MRENIKGGALTESTFYILLSLYSPNHGYGIIKFVEQETRGRVLLGAGTLYGAVNTLLKKGWICSYGDQEGVRKKEYLITEVGKEMVSKEMQRLAEIYESGLRIIGEGNQND
ncbi:MAG: putative transcriptional regulator [Clostridia bacterium]|nr:putative transcriptional regulator [Clostridia bacterium]